MRISEIRITRLFGLFDHDVPLNLSDRVTIIHGPNGYGKTTLLRLIDSLFAGRYSDIRNVPFRDLRITFDDGHVLEVVRVDAAHSHGKSRVGLTIKLRRAGKSEQHTTLPAVAPESLDFPLSFVERAVPYLSRVGAAQWRDQRTGEQLGLEEVVRGYPQAFPSHLIEAFGRVSEPDWLSEFRKSMRVRFIESQRLLRLGKGGSHRETDEPVRPAVVVYSRELAKLIQAKLAQYATLSQSLDRSFPKRLVEQTRTPAKSPKLVDALKEKLQQLEDRRASLTEAGLLDKEYEPFDLASYLTNPTLTESVLPVYAEDAEQKLAVFDDIAQRIELLTSIVKNHFRFKVMSITKEKGFEFATSYPGRASKPRPLSPAHLSSGEQHMLVLLYELLFTVEPNSLIMIDEPEISLHVAWQLEFLNDIQKITGVTGIDVLLATHAPGIINDRMDLTVELEAPVEAR